MPSLHALSYLDVEQMVREKTGKDLILAQVEKNNAYFTFDEILYLQERKLPNELVDYLLRYHLSLIPDIDIELLIKMKSVPLSDEIIEMLVNRYGVTFLPITPDEVSQLKDAKINDKLIEMLIRSSKN
ncbi:MAG: hypothetical protein HQM14_02810 [SAR324 cluster bacterium]|nr:hypothetical protein [SAR324 cluster bacterium]